MESLQNIFSYYSHPYVQSSTIIIVTIVSVFIARKLMYKVVEKYISNLVVRNQIIPLLEKPIFYTVTTQGFSIALKVLELSESVTNMGVNILQTLLVIVWGLFFLKVVKIFIHLGAKNRKVKIIKQQTLPLFDNLANTIIIIVAIFNIFSLWGIDMTAWLASAGIIGIAVGMAAKDTLANFLSGILIIADAPYKIGDYLVLESGERGKVTHIGIRSTRILTRDDVELTVPNSIMENSKIKNESGGGHRYTRVRVNVGVAYGTDLDQVEKVLMDIAQKDEALLQDPEPRVRWRMFGASSMDCQLMAWIADPEGKGKTIHELTKKIYAAFNKKGIEIPYAKQDLYVKEMPTSITN
jgi:MscS family membrane protein